MSIEGYCTHNARAERIDAAPPVAERTERQLADEIRAAIPGVREGIQVEEGELTDEQRAAFPASQ